MKTLKNKKGFTLMEMLIVVAIIAVLVAIAIPVYNDRLHKVRVAADWANLRAYYAEIQLDYVTSGVYNPKVHVLNPAPGTDQVKQTTAEMGTIKFLNEDTVKLQAGNYSASFEERGYVLNYYCKEGTHGSDHQLTLP